MGMGEDWSFYAYRCVCLCVRGGGGVDLPTLTVSQFLPFLSSLRNINLVFSRHSKKSQTEA